MSAVIDNHAHDHAHGHGHDHHGGYGGVMRWITTTPPPRAHCFC